MQKIKNLIFMTDIRTYYDAEWNDRLSAKLHLLAKLPA